MQFIASAATSLFGGGAATAATATAGAVGAGAAAAGSGFSFLNILQGAGGLLSAMGAVRAGEAQASAYRNQAADTRLDVTQEQIDAVNRQTSLRRQLVTSLGERDTAYAASGVDLSFGTPAVARGQSIDDLNRAVAQDQSTSDTRKSRLRARADSYEAMADDAEDAGWIRAAGGLFDSAISIVKRG